MTPVQAVQLNVKDKDEVFVIMESFERSLIFADVVVRVHPDFALAMHVDTDEANAFAGHEHPTGVILKLFGGRTYNLQKWADELQSWNQPAIAGDSALFIIPSLHSKYF